MFSRKNRKKGSAAVLIVIFFISVAVALSAIYEVSERKAVSSMSELAFDTAGRTVLSCYDRALQQDYGIFAFEGDDESIERQLKVLAEGSLSKASISGCEVEETTVEKTAFSLFQKDNFEFQITEMMKNNELYYDDMDCKAMLDEINEGFRKYKEAIQEAEELEATAQEEKSRREEDINENDSELSDDRFEELQNLHKGMWEFIENCRDNETAEKKDRILRNKRVTDVLPSKEMGAGMNQAFSVESGTGILKNAVNMENGSEEVALSDEYIMKYFGNYLESGIKDTFFRNEIEYILYGDDSDLENYKNAYRAVSAFRMAVNTSYVLNSEVKQQEISQAAGMFEADFFQPFTERLMALAWAAGETVNDMNNLEVGNGVPFAKNEACWVTDLESAVSGKTGIYKKINAADTMKYKDYLRLLLSTLDTDTKIYRIMDIIQINLKGRERQEFLISDHYTGFSVKAVINKKSRSALVPSGKSRVAMTHVYQQQ